LIVDTEKRAIGVAQREAEVFPELDADGAMLDHAMQTIDGDLRKVGAVDTAPVHPADGGETVRSVVEAVHDVERRLADLHRNVDAMLYAALVHNGEHFARVGGVEMIVIIDDRKARALDVADRRGQ